jgi:hypothetical protein
MINHRDRPGESCGVWATALELLDFMDQVGDFGGLGPDGFCDGWVQRLFSTIEKRQFDVEYLVEYIYISSEKWRILRTIPSYGIYIRIYVNIYIYGSYP